MHFVTPLIPVSLPYYLLMMIGMVVANVAYILLKSIIMYKSLLMLACYD